jgi:hypothetical protein
MPYKDAEQKKEWERLHRSQRLARRRELREAEAARKEALGEPRGPQAATGGSLLVALAAGTGLAAYNPKLAVGAGGMTVAAAILLKKNWNWWVVGILLVTLGLFFHWHEKAETE